MPTELSTPFFTFTSAREWQKLPSSDPSRVVLTCAEARTTVSLTMDAVEIPADKLEEAAGKLLKLRQETHTQGVHVALGQGEKATLAFGDQRVQAHASGQAWEVSYTGTEAGKKLYSFLGFVTPRKVVHLYIETALPLAEGQGEIFQEVIQGFQIALP